MFDEHNGQYYHYYIENIVNLHYDMIFVEYHDYLKNF